MTYIWCCWLRARTLTIGRQGDCVLCVYLLQPLKFTTADTMVRVCAHTSLQSVWGLKLAVLKVGFWRTRNRRKLNFG
jgi:hypothetical protein